MRSYSAGHTQSVYAGNWLLFFGVQYSVLFASVFISCPLARYSGFWSLFPNAKCTSAALPFTNIPIDVYHILSQWIFSNSIGSPRVTLPYTRLCLNAARVFRELFFRIIRGFSSHFSEVNFLVLASQIHLHCPSSFHSVPFSLYKPGLWSRS